MTVVDRLVQAWPGAILSKGGRIPVAQAKTRSLPHTQPGRARSVRLEPFFFEAHSAQSAAYGT